MLGREQTPAIAREIADLFYLFHNRSEHMEH